MKLSLLFFVFCICLWGCSNDKAQDELYEEVMTLHDEVMPKMENIMELEEKLDKKIEHLSEDSTVSKSELQKLEAAKQQLEEADKAMMEWMREFSTSFDDMAKEEVMQYLEKQKSGIKKVGQEMNQAIDYAKTQLEN